MNQAITVALVVAMLAALLYAIYKHVGAAKLKADLASITKDPKQVIEDALAAVKPAAATSPASASTAALAPVAPPAPVAAAVATPAAAAVPNPFIAWRAEGLTMYDAILRLTHYPSPAEMDLAVAAGYERPVAPPPDAPADTSVFISGDTYNFAAASGQNLRIIGPRKLTLPVPAGFAGLVCLGCGVDPDTHTQAHTSINGGQYPRDASLASATWTHKVRFGAQRAADEIVMPTTPMNVVYEIAEAPDSGSVISLQIYPDA